MEQHSDFYELIRHFWWLMFPICSLIGWFLHMNQVHDRNNRLLDMVKTYVDQGKEPPPELLAVLRSQNFGDRRRYEPSWIPVFLFAALAGGLVLMAFFPPDKNIPVAALPFGALIMASLSLGHLVQLLEYRKQNRILPP